MLPKLKTPLESAMMLLGCGSSGGGAAFSPLDLASLSEWWSIESLAPVGNGNPASSWVGERGLYTIANTSTARPTYTADDGDGGPSLQFDGVDDFLSVAISNAALFGTTGNFEWWFVIRHAASTPAGLFTSTGTNNQLCVYLDDTNIRYVAPQGPNEVLFGPTTAINTNTWHVLRFGKNGGRRYAECDGISLYDATAAAGTYGTGADTLYIGDYFGIAKFQGSIRHVLFTTAPLDAQEASDMLTYLEGFV